MEARVGIEPTNGAFAEPCLTTWLPRPGVRPHLLHAERGEQAHFVASRPVEAPLPLPRSRTDSRGQRMTVGVRRVHGVGGELERASGTGHLEGVSDPRRDEHEVARTQLHGRRLGGFEVLEEQGEPAVHHVEGFFASRGGSGCRERSLRRAR